MMENLIHTVLFSDTEIPVVITSEKKVDVAFDGIRLELRKGLKRDLPLKYAIPLIRQNLAKVDVTRLYTKGQINKIRWKEERIETLQEIDEDFYVKVRILLKNLEQEVKENPDNIELLSTLRQIKISVIDIIKARFQKIVKMALMNPEVSRELLKNMTKEERLLYVQVCDLLSYWYDSMQKFVDRGEVL